MAAHYGERAERPPAAQWRLVGEPSRGQGYPSRLGLDTASEIPRRRRGQGPLDYHCNVLRPDGQPDYRFNVLRPEGQRTPAAAKLAPGGRLGSPAGLYIDCVPDGVLLRALVDTGSTVSHGLWNCEPLIARQKGRMGVDTHGQLGSPMSSTGCGWQGGHEFCPTGTVLRLHSRTPGNHRTLEAGPPQDYIRVHPSPAKGRRRSHRQRRPPPRLRNGVRHGDQGRSQLGWGQCGVGGAAADDQHALRGCRCVFTMLGKGVWVSDFGPVVCVLGVTCEMCSSSS
ncbi:uncharacterized protein Hap1MRO34_021397 [Clarias gariepinus]